MAQHVNVFVMNCDEIRKIAQTRFVTVDIAARIFMTDEQLTTKMDTRQVYEDLEEWDALCRSYVTRPDATLKDMWGDLKKGQVNI